MSLSCWALALVVGDQAFDPQRHVLEAAGRVQARPQREAEVERRRAARLAPGHAEQRGHAGVHAPAAHALQALGHEDAVVGVELDDVGHRAERHQVEQMVELGLVLGVEHAAPAQLGAQGQQHVKHDADAGQVLARETAGRLVRIDDHARGRQRVGRQMVVGDDDVDAAPVRLGHAVDAGDAVIDRDDNVGRLFARRQRDDFRRQAVTVFEAVGHDEVDRGAHRGQAPQRDGAGGGAVAVVVGDDDHALAGGDRVGQEHGGRADVQQAGGRDQRRQLAGQFGAAGQAARRVQARQHRMDAVLAQHFGFAERAGAGTDACHGIKLSRVGLRQNVRWAFLLLLKTAQASR
jgi:hypothetical protein